MIDIIGGWWRVDYGARYSMMIVESRLRTGFAIFATSKNTV